MRLHRFFDPHAGAQTYELTDENLVHQIRTVFRAKKGEHVILFGNKEDIEYEIDTIEKKCINLSRVGSTTSLIQPRDIAIACALIKKDKFEWLVQKCTELGVTRFIPIHTDRSEKQNLNLDRLQKIAIEAVEQSGWGNVPVIEPIQSLDDVLSRPNVHVLNTTTTTLSAATSAEQPTFLIGPEGGWSDRELEFFKTKNIPQYSLGPQTLRAETAAIAAALQ